MTTHHRGRRHPPGRRSRLGPSPPASPASPDGKLDHLGELRPLPLELAAIAGIVGVGLLHRGAGDSAVEDELDTVQAKPVVAEPAAHLLSLHERQPLLERPGRIDEEQDPTAKRQQPALPRRLIHGEAAGFEQRLADRSDAQSRVCGARTAKPLDFRAA